MLAAKLIEHTPRSAHVIWLIFICPDTHPHHDSVLLCIHIMLVLTEVLICAGCESIQFPLGLDNLHCLV